MGNVELFEVCETNPQTQCTECLLYWSEGIVYCTCGHLLRRKCSQAEAPLNGHWIFSQFRTTWLRKGDLMAIAMGKLMNKDIILVAHNLRRRCQKRGFEGNHARFLKDDRFRASQLEYDRIEKSVSRWTRSRTKISPIIWPKKSTFEIRRIGWISLKNSGKTGPVRGRSDFNDALSTLNRAGQEQLRQVPFREISKLAPIIKFFLQLVAMERLMVELIIQMKVHIWAYMQSDMIERLWIKPQTCDFQHFLLQ